MITLDTSGLFALLDRLEHNHGRAAAALAAERGPYLVPMAILAEITYLVDRTLSPAVLDDFLADLDAGAFTLECGDNDLPRIRALVRRYADLSLGVPDAAVIACAERNGGRVLTFDLRDFGVVAREGTIEIVP